MKLIPRALLLLCLFSGMAFSESELPRLAAGFASPPIQARTRCFWWWLNGNVTKEAITRDLTEMQAKGFGGALIFDADGSSQRNNNPVPAGPIFGSPAWRELFKHAVTEADRLGLELSLNIQSGWNLGAPDVTEDEAAKQLTWSETLVEDNAAFDMVLPVPKNRGGYFRDIAVLAYRDTAPEARPKPIRQLKEKSAFSEIGGSAPDCRPLLNEPNPSPGESGIPADAVLDISEKMSPEGRLQWNAPEGSWIVLRFGYTLSGARVSTSSGGWQGPVVDYMSAPVLRAYWDRHVRPLLDDIGPLAGKSLKYLHSDSWECGGMNWSPGFEKEFRDRREYNPIPYLPIIAGRIVGNREISNRFLADFRKTIGECVAENHYAVFAELAHAANLGIHPESGGPHAGPFDALKCLGKSDMPMSEFWVPSPHRPKPENRFFVKQAASAAHAYGMTLAGAEGFTSIGPHWDDTLWRSAKPSFDHEACAGLNLTFIHTFTCSPPEMGLPGQEYFAGTHFNPNVTWWGQAGAVIGYMNRCQFLLQQGQFVADVCYYYGDHVPNIAARKEADPAGVLPAYDYDVIDETILCERMTVQDNMLALPGGMHYRLLVLPDHRLLSLRAIEKINELVRGGATVLGPKPERTASLTGYPSSEERFRQLADELWPKESNPNKNRKHINERVGAKEALSTMNVLPDCAWDGNDDAYGYIHRHTSDAEIYFVSNRKEEAARETFRFRVTEKQPELWDPLTGSIRAAKAFRQHDGVTELPLAFEPYGSLFVIFGKAISPDTQGAAETNFPEYKEILTLGGDWNVAFDPAWGGPETVQFDTLISWTDRPEEGIRCYSGTAQYRKNFDIPREMLHAGESLALDLGEVREIAEVTLNGQALGVLWSRPFRVDIEQAAKAGGNLLEIKVVNNWPNRLIGDAALPVEARHTKTNIARYKADTPLIPSGLLGPVRLLVRQPE
ncbi:MAG: (4-O-methyl)-D-glucuronate---lignin esterase [Candidatus Hydrogenedentes bacterium]|nr:(4-O-methyl)-D-glucuronate---lignin esterase [Candidatus Hydrogenedentota bacterium]